MDPIFQGSGSSIVTWRGTQAGAWTRFSLLGTAEQGQQVCALPRRPCRLALNPLLTSGSNDCLMKDLTV